MRFKTECPRCNKIDEVVVDNPNPQVHCGDCLMEHVELVRMICTPLDAPAYIAVVGQRDADEGIE
jgi:transcription elongation factor Elf1